MTLFRPAALAQLRSPDQLDQLLRVTTPQRWIGLAALLTLTAAAVGWGVFGSVTTSAQGLGILIPPGGIDNITAEGGGLVTEILVAPGQRVTKGQVVARLGQPVLKTEIKGVEADVQRLRDDYVLSSKLYEEGDLLYRKATQQQRTNLAFSIEAQDRRQKSLRENLKANQEALAKQRTQLETTEMALEPQLRAAKSQVDRLRGLRTRGVSTQREVDAAVREFDDIQIRLRTNQSERAKLVSAILDTDAKALKEEDQITESRQNFRNQLATVDKEESERSTKRKEELFAKRQALSAAEDKLRLLQARLEREGRVESPLTGCVVEILVDLGQVIQAGTPVVSLHDQDLPLGVAVWIPTADGQKVESGMRLEITPSAVKREEFGFIVGSVASVGGFPVTENAMTRLLQNKLLVQDLAKKGPAVEVLGSLQLDADAPSGFHWSSGLGPPIAIRHGMLCTCSVIVREQRPITLVIPALRKFFGIQ